MSAVVEVRFPEFDLHEGQLAFVKSTSFESLYVGGFGAGKSTALCVRALLLAHQFPGNKILISRKTMGALNDTTRRTFHEIMPPELFAGKRDSEDLTYINAVDGGVSTVYWRSFEDSPADWEKKFRSTDFGAIFIDEASEAPRYLTEMLIGRLRTKVGYRCINYVSNPTPKDHWMYVYFEGAKASPRQRQVFHGSTYENKEHLPPGYIEDMEKSYTPEQIEVLLKGKFGHIPTGLPVFPEFKANYDGKAWHVRSGLEPVKGLPILRGWDFGVIRPAIVWAQFGGQVKRVLREKMGHNTHTRQFGRMVKELSTEMFPGFNFVDYCDPQGFAKEEATGRSSVDELHDIGIRPIHLKKTNATYRAGLIGESLRRTVQTEHGMEPEFQLDAQCEMLEGGFIGNYRRAEPVPDKEVDDDPLKDGYYEHPMDSLGFIFVGRVAMGGTGSSSDGKERMRRQRQRAKSYGG